MKVDGKQKERKKNFDVKSFVVSSQDVRTTFLPVNIGSIFPRLAHFVAQDSKVVFVKRRNLDNLVTLETLAIDHNQIERIPSDVFSDLEILVKTDLSHNRLTNLDREFSRISKSSKFWSSTTITSKSSAKVCWSLIWSWRSLIRKKKQNKVHRKLAVQRFTKLEVRKFWQEHLHRRSIHKRISEISWRPNHNDWCVQRKVQQWHHRNVGFQQKSSAWIWKVLKKSEENFREKLELGCSRRKLLRKHEPTNAADFESKWIQSVSGDAFQKVKTSIEVIDSSSNKITQIEDKTFMNLVKLKCLKTPTKVENLASNLFVDNVNLEQVFVNNNKLKSIGPYPMNSLRKLMIADFSENDWINQKFPEMQLQVLKLKILESCQWKLRLLVEIWVKETFGRRKVLKKLLVNKFWDFELWRSCHPLGFLRKRCHLLLRQLLSFSRRVSLL